MKTQYDIDSYVSALRSRLHLKPEVRERIISEIEAHLQDRAVAHVADGMDRREAECLAVAEFGPAWRLALRFRLAYLDAKKMLAWAGALFLIARRVHYTYSAVPPSVFGKYWYFFVGRSVVGAGISLALGFGVTYLFPRRLVLGAAVATAASPAYWWIRMFVLGDMMAVHVWNGWKSVVVVRSLYVPSHVFAQYRDTQLILGLLLSFAWILMGVWAARAIRAKFAQMYSGRAVA